MHQKIITSITVYLTGRAQFYSEIECAIVVDLKLRIDLQLIQGQYNCKSRLVDDFKADKN